MMNLKTAIHNLRYIALCVFIIFFLMLPVTAAQSQDREITDMFGRKVRLPACPQQVYSTSPPITYMLYTIAPSILAGLNFPVREWEKKYLDKNIQTLPILGGWFGQGGTPNLEMVMKINPEIVVISKHNSAMDSKVDETMKIMPMPVFNVALESLADYPGVYLYLGQLLGREARATELAAYTRRTLSEMATLAMSVPDQKRVSVYYAQGVNGLSTECDSSLHAELISLVGARNVHRCQARSLYGMENISIEQVMLYNPDVMLVMEDTFCRRIFDDPVWHKIKAVQDKRVYLIPRQPFNWFDRPPSFMRLLGAKWLANLLYPEYYPINIVKEIQHFFMLFLSVELSAEEAYGLISEATETFRQHTKNSVR